MGAPTISASCSQSFQGSSITYVSSINTSAIFNWTVSSTPVGAAITSGQGTPTVTVTWPSGGAGTGTVNLSVTNSCGVITATKAVTINANPTLSGASSLYVATAGNGYACSQAGATYAWSSSSTYGTIVGSTTGQTINVTSANSAGTFTLTCVVSFGACSQTLTLPVTVSCPPSVGNVFSCSLAGVTYSWSSNSTYATIVGSNTTQSINVTAAATAGSFTLTCAVTDGACTYNLTFPGSVTCPHGTIYFSYTGLKQTFAIPACISSVTIVAYGGAGGSSTDFAGGLGAEVTATVTVVGGHTLDIVVGDSGVTNDYSGGGGGGTYIWDNASTTLPLVVAGGAGGGGFSSVGNPGSITLTPTTVAGQNGAGGAGGAAGAQGATTVNGAGGGGAGWNTVNGNPAGATAFLGAGGVGEPNGFGGGAGATNTFPNSNGGYGGGGGGGYNGTSTWGGGGGGGGYNGGGGGSATSATKQYGGGGGGSGYYNGATFVSPVTATATNPNAGSVSITY
jgi:hypothetical protein